MSSLWKSFLNLCLVKMNRAATLDTTPSRDRDRMTGDTRLDPGTGSEVDDESMAVVAVIVVLSPFMIRVVYVFVIYTLATNWEVAFLPSPGNSMRFGAAVRHLQPAMMLSLMAHASLGNGMVHTERETLI